MSTTRDKKLIVLGRVSRLAAVGGTGALSVLSPFATLLVRLFAASSAVVTLRWWDPIVTLSKLIRPKRVSVFIADGHFSLLNLNKALNKRRSRNIFEAGYCDIYLLPDKISLSAVSKYPGTKVLYHPNYWDDPNIGFSDKEGATHEIVIVYGNDPFFDQRYQADLLALVNDIIERYSARYRICHVLPNNQNGKVLEKGIQDSPDIYRGLGDSGLTLSADALYLCTPSTIVWQLISISAKVAVIDVYDEDACFHPAIAMIKDARDVAGVLGQSAEYWSGLRTQVGGTLGDRSVLDAIDSALSRYGDSGDVSRKWWEAITRHKPRDFFSSFWSVVARK